MSTALARVLGGLCILAACLFVVRPRTADVAAADPAAAAQALLATSKTAYDASRYQDALEPTLELTRTFPRQQIYAERLAVIYQHLNRPADEAAAWERVVEISPTPIDACPALAEAYVKLGGYTPQALDAFERCSGYDTSNTDMLFLLGQARERAGQADGAEAAYRRAIGVNAADADSQVALARIDLRDGKLDAAMKTATDVLRAYPDHADALLLAGSCALRQGHNADARRYLDRALAHAEKYPDVHISLGILDFSEGHVADAKRHFERAIELAPDRRSELTTWLERVKDSH